MPKTSHIRKGRVRRKIYGQGKGWHGKHYVKTIQGKHRANQLTGGRRKGR